jgi:Major Facilitator Superfamily
VAGRLQLLTLTAANAISLFGNVVAAVAIPWFVLVTTGSVARTGVAAFFATLPLALGALFGGVVADRVAPRTASSVGDAVSATAIAGIPLLHALDALEFWHLLALAFVGALFDAPAQAAREAALPDLADRAGVPLERATALWTSTEHAGYLLGAPAAGVLIAVGAPAALWLDAASFAGSAALVALTLERLQRRRDRRSYTEEFLEGVRFVLSVPALRTFFTVATIGNFLIAPLGPVLLPVYARSELGGAGALAVLVSAYGVGGLVGARSALESRRGGYRGSRCSSVSGLRTPRCRSASRPCRRSS